jgi:hypothetical protein
METLKVYVNQDDEAEILCHHCGTRSTINVEKFKYRKEPLKVRCKCRSAFYVVLEPQGADVRQAHLEGFYGKLPQCEEWGKILVRNISQIGMGCNTLTKHDVKKGDKIRVTLTLSTLGRPSIVRDAIVRVADDKYLGCEFSDPLEPNEVLPFPVMS